MDSISAASMLHVTLKADGIITQKRCSCGENSMSTASVLLKTPATEGNSTLGLEVQTQHGRYIGG
jgi:hypothetical protein